MLVIITKSNGIEWIRERKLSESGWDETVKSIAAGEWTDIHEVYRLFTGERVTSLIAEEVARLWDKNDEPLDDWQKVFLNANLSRKPPPSNVREAGFKVIGKRMEAAE